MARLKWEDRQYNGYFTMPGIGSRPRTRTDKDLKRRLTILGVRSYWRKLELYRKTLLARINGISESEGKLYPDLEEEALYTELRIMLDNLRSEVSSDLSGGIKHLLKMIEEIIRLISRVFHPSFQALSPCFAGSNLSAAANSRGPPTLVAAPFKVQNITVVRPTAHCLPSSPGPGNWIQTWPRILEIRSKLNYFLLQAFQAPDSGSNSKSPLIRNSLPCKVFKTLIDVIATGTERLLSPLSQVGLKMPRLVAAIVTLTAGSLFFGTVKTAVADPGDRIVMNRYGYDEGKQPGGTGFDNLENVLYYIENSDNSVYKVNSADTFSAAPGTFVLNLEAGDEYFGLGFGRVEGVRMIGVTNKDDGELEIYNVDTRVQINSKIMPANPKGVTFNNGWDVLIDGAPIRIDKYNKNSLSLEKESDNLDLAGMTNLGESEIAFDSINNLYYAISNDNSKVYTFNLENGGESQTMVTNLNEWELESSGYDINGSAFNESTLELILTTYKPYWAYIMNFEGYDAPPTPTPIPTPTPEPNGTGIFRPSSGLWAINGVTRTYFGGSNDTPVYNDFDGDGIKDISIFRKNSGLWAVKDLTRTYFGGNDDKPVPADYNGNGTDDIAIYRGNSGLWAVKGISRAYFGNSDDTPVPADYNGDGTKDIAIFRPDTGLWAVRNGDRKYFGKSEDTPVPADYDGDGTNDIAIFRPSSGLWAINGVTRTYFGNSSDTPVPSDYDGDDTDDVGIFRESAGLWAIRGLSRCYFGGVGDIPVTR